VKDKQTYLKLANRYKYSKRTIQRKIDLVNVTIKDIEPRKVIVLMDTTYWGRGYGVMLFKDSINGDNLLKYYVVSETNALY
jgi:hypothetical protein